MNYRHAFHAGNFADVHKHLTLLAVLDYLLQKPKPLFFLDTHAGRGWYDLRSNEAERGAEWQDGIGRLAARYADTSPTSPLLKRYLEAVLRCQSGAGHVHGYPGSPLLATHTLRDVDRRVFIERHAEECVALRKVLRQEHAPNTSIDDSDGYHALGQFLPPREKRGLVLIDPPFEDAQEFRHLSDALIKAVLRWPTGVYAVWLPLKSGGLIGSFYAALRASGLRKLLLSECWVRPPETPAGLNGSAMLLINPPWQLDEQLRVALAELLPILSDQGQHRINWLVPE